MEINTELIIQILVPALVGSIIIWLNPPENNRRVFGNWKNWFILILFTYGWTFLSILIHESGHGIVAHLFGWKVPKWKSECTDEI